MNITVDKALCNGCGVCVDLCPLDNLRLDDEGYVVDKYNECWYCNVCEAECPQQAIRLRIPFLIR